MDTDSTIYQYHIITSFVTQRRHLYVIIYIVILEYRYINCILHEVLCIKIVMRCLNMESISVKQGFCHDVCIYEDITSKELLYTSASIYRMGRFSVLITYEIHPMNTVYILLQRIAIMAIVSLISVYRVKYL